MNNKKTTKISIYISERAYEDLKKLSVKKRTSMANLVRNFVTKGLNVENHDENEEEFRRMIHDEMTEVIKQEDVAFAVLRNCVDHHISGCA